MQRRTAIVVLVGSIAFTAAARISVNFLQFKNVERRFREVKIGWSRSDVRSHFGDPNNYSAKCGTIHVPPKDCASEFIYPHPFAPLLSDYYVISFSIKGKVIEAEHWTSR